MPSHSAALSHPTPSLPAQLSLPALSPRSVLLSTLLGINPPRLRAAKLLAMAELFGVDDADALTALARMEADGDVSLENGRYRLAPRFAARQRRQEQSRVDPRQPWNGRWSMAVLDRDVANPPDELRRSLAALHYGEWRPGVWLRPDNLGPRSTPMLRRQWPAWSAELPHGVDGRALVRRLWDLDGWAAQANGLLAAMPVSLDIATRFAVAVAATMHLLADPLLPDGLSPAGWPAAALRREFAAFAGELEAELALFLRG